MLNDSEWNGKQEVLSMVEEYNKLRSRCEYHQEEAEIDEGISGFVTITGFIAQRQSIKLK